YRLYAESLRIKRQIGDRQGCTTALEGFADLAALQGQAERAARLWGAADGLRRSLGIALPPNEHASRDRYMALARTTLDEPTFAAAWETGFSMPIEQPFALALADG